MGASRKRPAKISDPLSLARTLLATGDYRDTRHANERRQERDILRTEIRFAILNGFNEKSKDEFKPEWNSWNYAIRGKTVDGRDLRVAVAFEESSSLLIIVTAIDLGAKGTLQ